MGDIVTKRVIKWIMHAIWLIRAHHRYCLDGWRIEEGIMTSLLCLKSVVFDLGRSLHVDINILRPTDANKWLDRMERGNHMEQKLGLEHPRWPLVGDKRQIDQAERMAIVVSGSRQGDEIPVIIYKIPSR